MKRFFKRLGYGLDKVLTILLFVVFPLLFAIDSFFNIDKYSGWYVVWFFTGSVAGVFWCLLGIYTIGTEIDEYKQLKKDKEKENNPELLKGGVDK